MARAMAGYIGGLLADVYGVAQSADEHSGRSVADRRGDRDGRGHQPDRGGDSGAQRGAAWIR